VTGMAAAVSHNFLGELAALGTALAWTVSLLIWTAAGRRAGSIVVGFLRLVVTLPLVALAAAVFYGRAAPAADARGWTYMGLSGLAGFFLADVLLFRALVVGARLTTLVQSLAPPLTALIAWAAMDELLGWHDWLAMGVTLAGVAWVVLERPGRSTVPGEPRRRAAGLLLAGAGAAAQAVALVLAREGIAALPALDATFIRILGGLAGYLPLVSLTRRWAPAARTVRDKRAAALVLAGSAVGPLLGVTLYMTAIARCQAGVVATITATMPVLVLPFVVFLHRERVSPRAAAGAALAVAGVAMLVLW